jgi:23S rRNA pseudouridine1911/1915/1917 synthase
MDEVGNERAPDRWKVSERAAGMRLDAYLSKIYRRPRNQVVRWIREGRVAIGSGTVKPALRLQGGEWLSCEPAVLNQEGVIEPEEGEITLLHEDDALLVLDKPADLVVHPGAGRRSGTLAHRLLARFPETGEVGGPGRPGIVHRLDRGTSGVMVVARTAEAYQTLSRAFADRRVEKTYLALVFGEPSPSQGTIDAPLARHRERRKEMTVAPSGRPATTHYRTVDSAAGISFLELRPETGRTHQIRVHLKHHGHPLLGDPVYGEARWRGFPKTRQKALRDLERPALHAWRLAFVHPQKGERVEFEAPLPAALEDLWYRVTGREIPPFE